MNLDRGLKRLYIFLSLWFWGIWYSYWAFFHSEISGDYSKAQITFIVVGVGFQIFSAILFLSFRWVLLGFKKDE